MLDYRADWDTRDVRDLTNSVAYHGHNLSVFWDPQGTQWPKAGCKGLCLFVDGKLANRSAKLSRLEVTLE